MNTADVDSRGDQRPECCDPSTDDLSPIIRCPVCHVVCESPPSAAYTPEKAAAHFTPQTRDADRNRRLTQCIRRLWGDRNCLVFHCAACGFGFGYPFVGGDEEFYSILHEQHGYPRWRWDYDLAIKRAIKRVTKGRILDVGAGTGVFLRRLSPEWEKYATEGSGTTRDKLRAVGIHVFETLSAAESAGAGTFHVITLFQVLEHVAEFADTLRRCRLLLVPGGVIFVTVPDARAMLRQEELIGCPDMPPNHICKWTPRSLRRALRDSGFEPDEPSFEGASFAALRGVIHLRILANRENPNSLARKIYCIPSRKIRAICLALLGVPTALQLLPHLRSTCRGGAFAMMGVAN